MAKNWRDISRMDWATQTEEDGSNAKEKAKVGALQRIADAVEVIAKDRINLQDGYDYQKKEKERYYQYWLEEQRRNSALKGVITKLRKKYEQSPEGAATKA